MKPTTTITRNALAAAACLFAFFATPRGLLAQHIEQLMRDYQARYHLFNPGSYLTWPQCSAGQTPAPHFPKDGFYGDIIQDPDRGVELVQDLVQKFYYDAPVYTSFVNAPNGISDVQGAA